MEGKGKGKFQGEGKEWGLNTWLAASSRILRILLSHLSGSVGWVGITVPKVHERVELTKRQFPLSARAAWPLG